MPISARRFRRDAKRFTKKLDKGVTDRAIFLAKTARHFIMADHPILTGRGIQGWNVSVGAPVKSEPGTVSARSMQLGQTVYVANGVPYLHFPEFGTVRITPRLFISNALAQMGFRPAFHVRGAGAIGSTKRALPGGL